MFKAPRRAPLAVVALALLAACGPSLPPGVEALNKAPSIQNLVSERLRSELTAGQAPNANIQLVLPARVRIVPYDFETNLQKVDLLANMDQLATELKKQPDLIKDATLLPESYGKGIGASFEGLMKLHESVNADAFILVSGRASFVEASERGVGFFDWWAKKAWWEAHVELETMWVQAPSGKFLSPLQVAAKAGPEIVGAGDQSTSSGAYALRRQVAKNAFTLLAAALVKQLKDERSRMATPSPSPAASASPSPSPSPEGSASPSPSPTGSPDPSASPTASATPSPSGSGSPAASASPTASPSPGASASPAASASPTASPTASPS